MFYCKDLKSLSVLSLFEGELIGQVDKLYFDKKMKKLCEIELIGADGVKLSLSTKNIYRIGKNAITIKNNQCVEMSNKESEFRLCPIGTKAYSITGEFLGVVQEISLNNRYLTEKISLDNGAIVDVRNLATCGKNTMIFYQGNQKVNMNNFEPKSPKSFKSEEQQIAKTMPIEKEDKIEKQTTQTSNFLIGRVCTKDIFNFNNELLIKAHSVVNKKNLKEINKFGKLKELMIYSK